MIYDAMYCDVLCNVMICYVMYCDVLCNVINKKALIQLLSQFVTFESIIRLAVNPVLNPIIHGVLLRRISRGGQLVIGR